MRMNCSVSHPTTRILPFFLLLLLYTTLSSLTLTTHVQAKFVSPTPSKPVFSRPTIRNESALPPFSQTKSKEQNAHALGFAIELFLWRRVRSNNRVKPNKAQARPKTNARMRTVVSVIPLSEAYVDGVPVPFDASGSPKECGNEVCVARVFTASTKLVRWGYVNYVTKGVLRLPGFMSVFHGGTDNWVITKLKRKTFLFDIPLKSFAI